MQNKIIFFKNGGPQGTWTYVNLCKPSLSLVWIFSELHNVALLFAVNIAPATSVRIPEAVTPQQAASGQTAILYPSAHSHALGQMVCIISSLLG